jgi:hypothetical protein
MKYSQLDVLTKDRCLKDCARAEVRTYRSTNYRTAPGTRFPLHDDSVGTGTSVTVTCEYVPLLLH